MLSIRVREHLCFFSYGLGFPCEADVNYTVLNDCVCVICVSSYVGSGALFPGRHSE